MGDQHRWFKLWASAPGDSFLQTLLPCDRWAWVAFGVHTKVHGTRGRITIRASDAVLAAEMGVTQLTLFDVIKRLPHIVVEEGKTVNGELTVTWQNWSKYQEDSTVSERVRRLRSKRRGEEKRGEEKKNPSVSPLTNGHHSHDQARAVLAFLNLTTHRGYRDTPATLRLIECRLEAGATLQDCKTIIARKWREWGTDPKMTSYVRPATLFNATKFEQYRGELNL